MVPDSACLSPGYDDGMATRFPTQSQNLNAPVQFNGSLFALQNQFPTTSNEVQLQRSENVLAIGPPQSSTSGFQNIGASNFTSFRGVDDFFSEEEIRMRSHEMLENEDMQNLLRIFNAGGGHGHGHVPSVTEDSFTYSSGYMPKTSMNYNFDDDRTRSGKAVVGWLKLKAALRWGIFIRKRAAEKRAQLVELDDS